MNQSCFFAIPSSLKQFYYKFGTNILRKIIIDSDETLSYFTLYKSNRIQVTFLSNL